MKGINVWTALISLFLGLARVTPCQAEEYYIYQSPAGTLIISNKEPPPGSKIIKHLPGISDNEVLQAREPDKPRPNVEPESASKPAKEKQP